MKLLYVAVLATATMFAGHHDPAKRLRKMDTNNDGRVSLDEFKASRKNPANAEKRFRKLDANHDGFVTADELPVRPSKQT